MDTSTLISDAAGVATAAGVVFGAAQLLLGRAQARTGFEDDVATQYRQLVKPELAGALLTPVREQDRERVRHFYEYFDLSNEQVFLRMQGRIRRRTWDQWAEGIKSNLTREPISSAWEAVRYQLPEFDELRLLHEADYCGDPRKWNPWWRRVVRRELSASDERVKRTAERATSRFREC